jgi:hypothetical protein
MQKIEVTTDYSIFKKHESNRPIDEANLKRIIFSVKTNNMLALRPILVDQDMRVLDGQHRLEAAKKLGVAIYYQVNQAAQSADIILLNANQKGWNLMQYVNFYAQEGNKEYIKIIEFCNKRNIKTNDYFYMLRRLGGNLSKKIKTGTYIHDNTINEVAFDQCMFHLDEVLNTIRKYRLDNCDFINKSFFKSGLMAFLITKDIDMDIFLKKIITKVNAVRRCVNIGEYMQMFVDIYNWRNANPIDNKSEKINNTPLPPDLE